MSAEEHGAIRPDDLESLIARIRRQTPARVFAGRIGSSYRTETQLALREDHAAAIDAVHAELDLVRDLGAEFVERWGLFQIETSAKSKAEYLLRPDLGRKLDDRAITTLLDRCPVSSDIQVVIGDGLSATAVAAQVPPLFPLLAEMSGRAGLSFGQSFLINRCRVGVMNDIGVHLKPMVVVLLIGERPGLATSESLSAYLAYRPDSGQTDAHRNLISNIHGRGTSTLEAADRILRLAIQMIESGRSGVEIKEVPPKSMDTPLPASD